MHFAAGWAEGCNDPGEVLMPRAGGGSLALAGHTEDLAPRELGRILSLPVTEMGSVLLQANQVQNDSKMLDGGEVVRVEA